MTLNESMSLKNLEAWVHADEINACEEHSSQIRMYRARTLSHLCPCPLSLWVNFIEFMEAVTSEPCKEFLCQWETAFANEDLKYTVCLLGL